MNQIKIGQFIAQRRKERNMTQSEFADKIGVSNKSVSKWECGKCLPDYSIVELLCEELEITPSELLNGKLLNHENNKVIESKQTIELIERVQKIEKERELLIGLVLIVMGFAMNGLGNTTTSSQFQLIMSGFIKGISIALPVIGSYFLGRSLAK